MIFPPNDQSRSVTPQPSKILMLLILCTLSAGASGQVHLQEYLVSPIGGFFGGIDANGDGVLSADDDEFVEIANLSSTLWDISSWTISDAAGVRHSFASPTLLPPGAAIVIFGGGNLTWFNNQGAAIAVTASSGGLDLSDAGDTITIKDASGFVMQTQTYVSGGSAWAISESVTRAPESMFGTFTPHSQAPPSLYLHSAGHQNNAIPYLTATLPPFSPLYPGNGSDIGIDVRVNGLVPFSNDGVFPVTTGDLISMRYFSPAGGMTNAPFLAAFEVIASSVVLPQVTLPGDAAGSVWLSPAIAVVILNGLGTQNRPFSPTLAPGGLTLGPFTLPPYMAANNISIVLQAYTQDAGLNAVNLGTSTAYRLMVQ